MASRFWVGGTGTWDASDTTHWAASSGAGGGQSVPGSGDTVTFDGSSGGGTVTVNTNFNVISVTMGAFTGTLDFSVNNNSPTMQTFSGTGSGTRTLSTGTGTWTITGNNATIWNFTTTTNLTLNGGATIDCNYSGSTGTRVINTAGTSLGRVNFKISAGSDATSMTSSTTFTCADLDCTGYSGAMGFGTSDISGSLTLGASQTVTSGNGVITFSMSSSKNLTTNNVQTNHPITINGSGTLTLKNNLDMGGATPRQLVITQGILDVADSGATHNVTCGSFSSSGSTARSLLMGSGLWTITSTGTIWNMTTITNLTLNAGTSTISVTDTSASTKTIVGSVTLNNVTITGGGAAAIIFNGTMTMNLLTVNAPNTITFTSAKTYTLLSNPVMTGSAGNIITINSSSAGSAATLSKASGIISLDYLSIQDSTATGGATWYAGANSTNVSGNTGWNFTAPERGRLILLGVG